MVMEIKRLLLPLLPQSHHTLHYTYTCISIGHEHRTTTTHLLVLNTFRWIWLRTQYEINQLIYFVFFYFWCWYWKWLHSIFFRHFSQSTILVHFILSIFTSITTHFLINDHSICGVCKRCACDYDDSESNRGGGVQIFRSLYVWIESALTVSTNSTGRTRPFGFIWLAGWQYQHVRPCALIRSNFSLIDTKKYVHTIGDRQTTEDR